MDYWTQTPEVLTQIGFEAKFFKFDPSTIIACFGAENWQKHGYSAITDLVVRSPRLVGWVERNNTGSKIAQLAWKSETQPPQRLLFVGFPCVNPTYNNCWLIQTLESRRVRSLMGVLLLHRSIFGNAPCRLIEAVTLSTMPLLWAQLRNVSEDSQCLG